MEVKFDPESAIQPTTDKEVVPDPKEKESEKGESDAPLTTHHAIHESNKEDVRNDTSDHSRGESKVGSDANGQATVTGKKETVDQGKGQDIMNKSRTQVTTSHVVHENNEKEVPDNAENQTGVDSRAGSETNGQATANQETLEHEEEEAFKRESHASLKTHHFASENNEEDVQNDASNQSKVESKAESEQNGQAAAKKETLDEEKGKNIKRESDAQLTAEREPLKEQIEDLRITVDCDLKGNEESGSKTDEVNDIKVSDTKHSEHETKPKAAGQDEGVKTMSLDHQSTDKATELRKYIEELKEQLSVAKEMRDMSEQADVCCCLGRSYNMLGDLNQALEYHSFELQTAKLAKDTDREGRAYCFLGFVHLDLGGFNQSIRCFRLALSIAIEEGQIEKQRICYINLNTVYQKLGDSKQVIECKKSLLEIVQSTGNKSKVADLACELGILYDKAGFHEKAIESHKLDMEIAKNLGNRANERRAYSNLGISYKNLGNFAEAIDCHMRALDIAKKEGSKEEQGKACGNLGMSYQGLGDVRQAEWYHKLQYDIAKELGNKEEEGRACSHLGLVYNTRGDYVEALQYHELDLKLAKEARNRDAEGRAYCNLGVVNRNLGNYEQAISYGNSYLNITKETADKVGEGRAYLNLGQAHDKLFDFKQALECYKSRRDVVKELGDRIGEGDANCSLGWAYLNLGNLKEAIECHKLDLQIAKGLDNKTNEARAYCNLAIAYSSVGGFKEALEYNKLLLQVSQELEHREGQARAYCNLGTTYLTLCDFKKSIECTQRYLEMTKKVKNRDGVGRAYCHLALAHVGLGDHPKAIKYQQKHLAITQELGDKVSEGRAYANLGISYRTIGQFSDAINCHKLNLQIATQLGDRRQELSAYGNLGNSFYDLLDFQQAEDYFKKSLALAKEIGHKPGESRGYGNIGNVLRSLGNFKEALQYHEQDLAMAQEMGEKNGEGLAHYCCGLCFEALGFLDQAILSYRASVNTFNSLRELLQSKDEWKIGLRNRYQMPYRAIWNLLLKLDKFEEALCESDKGRAQALEDLLTEQYGYGTVKSRAVDVTLEDFCNLTPTTVLYIAVGKDGINLWTIKRGGSVYFWKEKVDFQRLKLKEVTDLESLVKTTVEQINPPSESRCEDRSLDGLDRDFPVLEKDEENDTPIPTRDVGNEDDDTNSTKQQVDIDIRLRILYDVTIRPVADRIGGNELILVPDGPLFLAPFAAFLDSNSRCLGEYFTIRVVPSLYSLKLIVDAPQDYHCTKGALIVGDPCVKEIVKKEKRKLVPVLEQLPNARQEAIMIASILNTTPLIGEKATKGEVLKNLSAVALVHIAAHGRSETGEIALTPNPERRCKIPEEDDYMLSMAEVLSVGLRAKLVVLSCCHSGRGSIKAEGVVGIARAFMGAGARSVLVSLWAVNDEATLEFMRSFYQRLLECKSSSKALNQAMKSMRESDAFKAEKYWAPFVLIGDDVSFDFQELQSVP